MKIKNYLSLPLVQRLPALQYEGDAVPSLVVDPQHGGSKGRAGGTFGDSFIVQISQSAVRILAVGVPFILAQHTGGDSQGRDCLQHLNFLIPKENVNVKYLYFCPIFYR